MDVTSAFGSPVSKAMRYCEQLYSRSCLIGLLLTATLALAGCLGRSRPPVLQQGKAVYRNTTEGFRLAPPPGWLQQGRGEPTRADRAHECQLVKYQRVSENKPAFFQVWVVEAPADTDLAAYLAKRPADKTFKHTGTNETIDVDHVPAVREVLVDTVGNDKILREIVAVQRTTRIYLLVGVYPLGDDAARDQIRDAVGSVAWEGDPK
jgi:hypothetical protein